MTDKNRNEILEILETGTVEEKSALLEEILGARDSSLVSPLVDFMEKEKSRAVKERILKVLDRLIPLSELRDVDISLDIHRMLSSSDPFVRNGIVEIIIHSEIPLIQFLKGNVMEIGDTAAG